MLTFLVFLMFENPLALVIDGQDLSSAICPTSLFKNLGLKHSKLKAESCF